MRVQDLDAKNSVASSDELIITDSSHKSWRTTFANFIASITSLANLAISTLFQVTGDTQLADTTITGDVGITGDTDITGDLDVTGDVSIAGGLEVTGDIIQHGQAYETHAQKVYTKDDVINLRDGAIAGLAAGEYAGVIAKHYDADGNDGALVFNRSGEARVGDYTVNNVTVYSSDGIAFYTDAEMTEPATIPAGVTPTLVSGTEYTYTAITDDTEPLLTRDEIANMTDKAIAVWDATAKKVKAGPVPAVAGKVAISKADGSFEWGDISQNIQGVFNILRPVGSVYTQYPGQPSPNTLWSSYSTWEVLNYAGAFFRANGGNALNFEASLTVDTISGTTITFTAAHGLSVGSLLYDPEENECRTVTSVTDTTTVEVDTAFTSLILTNVLIGQSAQAPNIVGSFRACAAKSDTTSGAFTANKNYTSNWRDTGSGVAHWDFNASNSGASTDVNGANIYTDNGELRPENYTIKIWKRVS